MHVGVTTDVRGLTITDMTCHISYLTYQGSWVEFLVNLKKCSVENGSEIAFPNIKLDQNVQPKIRDMSHMVCDMPYP